MTRFTGHLPTTTHRLPLTAYHIPHTVTASHLPCDEERNVVVPKGELTADEMGERYGPGPDVAIIYWPTLNM